METETDRQVAEALVRALGYADDDRVRAVFIVGSAASGQGDAYSDVDMLVAVDTLIPDDERLKRLRAIGCWKITLAIAGAANPALPVQSHVIDKFVFRDTWFDVSYHLPHQLEFCFDYVTLVDKDDLASGLCTSSQEYSDAALKARAQADLRLLHARIYRYEKYAQRREWVGLDLSAIKNLVVDLVMVLNDRPNYNRHSSRMSQLLGELPVKPERFDQELLDILHLDNREAWPRKIEMLHRLETDLAALGEARWGPIAMFDDEDVANG
jgi:predicted nucleotidyltransferase